MIGHAASQDTTGALVQDGQQGNGSAALVLKLHQLRVVRAGGQAGSHSLDGLQARAFVQTEQMLGVPVVELKDMLHFGEELGVSYVKKVVGSMWLESVILKNPMDRGLARGCTHFFRMGFIMK